MSTVLEVPVPSAESELPTIPSVSSGPGGSRDLVARSTSTPDETPPPRKERTAALLAQAAGCSGAEREALLDQVIVINIPVAHTLAHRYRNRGQAVEELEQVACLALTRAVHGFDPERGDDLLVFAVPTILGELKRHFRAASWSVRPPRRLQELRPRLVAADDELTQRLGHPPTTEELAEELGCSASEVDEARACGELAQAASLDEPVAVGGSSLADLLPSAEPGFEHSEAVAMLAPACRTLKERDRRILQMRFYDQLTQQQIATELGVTQVQVSRLLQRILRDLRAAVGVPDQPRAA